MKSEFQAALRRLRVARNKPQLRRRTDSELEFVESTPNGFCGPRVGRRNHRRMLFAIGSSSVPSGGSPASLHAIADLTGSVNKQIASEFGTSEITVKKHRGHPMRKVQAQLLAQLVRRRMAKLEPQSGQE